MEIFSFDKTSQYTGNKKANGLVKACWLVFFNGHRCFGVSLDAGVELGFFHRLAVLNNPKKDLL
jgi:hypothetical protein